MSAYDAPDKAGTIVPFAPTPKGQQDTGTAADDSGRTIVALLQKTANAPWTLLINFRFSFGHPKNG